MRQLFPPLSFLEIRCDPFPLPVSPSLPWTLVFCDPVVTQAFSEPSLPGAAGQVGLGLLTPRPHLTSSWGSTAGGPSQLLVGAKVSAPWRAALGMGSFPRLLALAPQ